MCRQERAGSGCQAGPGASWHGGAATGRWRAAGTSLRPVVGDQGQAEVAPSTTARWGLLAAAKVIQEEKWHKEEEEEGWGERHPVCTQPGNGDG